MPRIVKRQAIPVIIERPGKRIRRYSIEDTIEIKKGWRPDGYVPVDDPEGLFEAGFDACLEELEKL